jgi:L,D-peptidoglycan transpeptidase YkuD (ErfK/YbiS/YcfS/YnhG family)
MGMGRGVVENSIAQAPVKREGDKKSPAGIFLLGKAFGYASAKEVPWLQYPYIQSGDTVFCVDDPTSRYYNRIIGADTAIRDYQSFEHMKLKSSAYKWGVFVEHNYPQTISGVGSCIFLHVWDSPEEGTVGCTAMQEEHMVRILKWLEEKKNPLLIQMTEAAYKKIAQHYRLPRLE